MSSFSKVTSPMIKLLKILRILRYLKSPYISLSFYQLISCWSLLEDSLAKLGMKAVKAETASWEQCQLINNKI